MAPNNRKRAAATTQPRDGKKAKRPENHRPNEHDGTSSDEHVQAVEDSDQDTSTSQSRLMNQWIRQLKDEHEKDTWAKDFQARVFEEKEDLLANLDGKISALENQDQQFRAFFGEVLATATTPVGVNLSAESSLISYGALGVQPLHQKSTRLLEASHELLKSYCGLINTETFVSTTAGVREELMSEAQFARKLVAAGKTSVRWDMKTLLHGTKGELKTAPPTKDVTLNEMVETMLEQGRENQRHGRAWGEMATDVKKAYKKVYKIAKRFE